MANPPLRPDPASSPRSQRGAAMPWVFFGFLAVAGFFFFTEHRAHLMGALPFLLLALCPLMHFFHGGHADHRGAGGHAGHRGAGGHAGHGAPGPDLRDGGDGAGSPDRAGTTPAPRPPHPH